MNYFDVFPTVTVNGLPVKDISRSITVLNDLKPFISNFVMTSGDSANDVAYKLYGTDDLYWLIYLVNPGYIFNEVMSDEEFTNYINDEFCVTCIQFSDSLNLLPPINSPVGLKVYDQFDTELTIKKIDVIRRQVVLEETVDGPIRVFYEYNDQLVRVEDIDLIRIYLDPDYLMYQDDYVVYDENGIPPFHFTKTEYKDALRHYNYNGIAYDRYPTGIEEILVDSYTWYEYEFALNELRRNRMIYIKIIN